MTAPEITLEGLFDAIGFAGHDIAKGMREDDRELGVNASSALLNAIAMLPEMLREEIARACTDRSLLAPMLQEIAL